MTFLWCDEHAAKLSSFNPFTGLLWAVVVLGGLAGLGWLILWTLGRSS